MGGGERRATKQSRMWGHLLTLANVEAIPVWKCQEAGDLAWSGTHHQHLVGTLPTSRAWGKRETKTAQRLSCETIAKAVPGENGIMYVT